MQPVSTGFHVDIDIYEDKLSQSGDRILSSQITTLFVCPCGALGCSFTCDWVIS